ncbi:unnamed protein product [Brassica rapa subsp. trilocularis]
MNHFLLDDSLASGSGDVDDGVFSGGVVRLLSGLFRLSSDLSFKLLRFIFVSCFGTHANESSIKRRAKLYGYRLCSTVFSGLP